MPASVFSEAWPPQAAWEMMSGRTRRLSGRKEEEGRRNESGLYINQCGLG
jgi:hypothetical protein